MKTLRGILVDVKNGVAPIKIDYNNYHDITDILNCEWIACVRREIGGVIVDVYCDDEALLKPAREPAIITRDKKTQRVIEVLFGNCFICLHNKSGDVKNLPYKDYNAILSAQATMYSDGKPYQVLQAVM